MRITSLNGSKVEALPLSVFLLLVAAVLGIEVQGLSVSHFILIFLFLSAFPAYRLMPVQHDYFIPFQTMVFTACASSFGALFSVAEYQSSDYIQMLGGVANFLFFIMVFYLVQRWRLSALQLSVLIQIYLALSLGYALVVNLCIYFDFLNYTGVAKYRQCLPIALLLLFENPRSRLCQILFVVSLLLFGFSMSVYFSRTNALTVMSVVLLCVFRLACRSGPFAILGLCGAIFVLITNIGYLDYLFGINARFSQLTSAISNLSSFL